MNLNIEELENYITQKAGGKEFFFGAWSPQALPLESEQIPQNIQLEKGDNWFMCRNGKDVCDGIIFSGDKAKNEPEAVLFRGYLSEAGIYSYSDSEKILDYWNKDPIARHNGIFSAIIISQEKKEVKFITDIFGISPIYYRIVDDIVLFSSAPGLLSQRDDEPDLMSWKKRLEIGYIPSNKSLIKDVEIAPPASVMTFSGQGLKFEKWYDYNDFAKGDKDLDDHALEQYEKTLCVAMERCKSIQHGRTILPFSSGYDSRRLFVHLQKNNIPFETCTIQVDDNQGRDIDSVCATKIATDHNIDQTVFPMPSEQEWLTNHLQRIISVDAHTIMHSWSVPIFNHYHGQNITFYDGLGGDVLGNSGWDYKGLYDNPHDKFSVIIRGLFKNTYDNKLKPTIFPTYDATLADISTEYHKQPKGVNQSEVTFCLWQTRRSTSLWNQQQIRPGQVIICPFLDLDSIEEMFQFSPEQKLKIFAQGVTLRKYWPEIAAYPGSRDLPKESPNIGSRSAKNTIYALRGMIKAYFKTGSDTYLLRKIVPLQYRILLYLSQYNNNLARKISWWSSQIIELVTWWNSRPFIYSITKKEK